MRIAWVHPSWRDLVIDRLADDAVARREFLAACGIEGALLALSIGGGRAGERRLPLLRADADWDAFGGGLHALVRDADDPCLVRLFGALGAALAARVDAGRRGELAPLARTVLEDVRDRWDAGHRPLALAPLEAWFEASEHLQPPPRRPDVATTWFELLPPPDPSDLEEKERAAEWLGLVEILGRHDPATLLRLGNAGRVEAVADALAEPDEADPPPVPDPAEEILAAYAERRLVERVLSDL